MRFESLTIGDSRSELHRLVRLRFRIMRRLDEVDRSADLVLSAAAELIEAVKVEQAKKVREALPESWTLGL
ncbi:hypothetical protein ACWGTO_25655 [Mesorhizobium sp. PL10]